MADPALRILSLGAMRMLAVSEFEEKLSAEDNVSMTGCSPFSCVTGEEVHAGDEEHNLA